jgi:hypothetical protein
MADFAHWVSACETVLWPAGTFARAYAANRRTAIERVIDGDPVASRIREILAHQQSWTGTAAELLRYGVCPRDAAWAIRSGWPKNPRALAGRLRRAQPGLRSLGIDIVFSREGRAGTRTITMSRSVEHTVRTVSPRPSADTLADKLSSKAYTVGYGI